MLLRGRGRKMLRTLLAVFTGGYHIQMHERRLNLLITAGITVMRREYRILFIDNFV